MTKDYGVELKDALGWGWGRLLDKRFEVTTAQQVGRFAPWVYFDNKRRRKMKGEGARGIK